MKKNYAKLCTVVSTALTVNLVFAKPPDLAPVTAPAAKSIGFVPTKAPVTTLSPATIQPSVVPLNPLVTAPVGNATGGNGSIPKITYLVPPNISAESNVGGSGKSKVQSILQAFAQMLNSTYGSNAATDPSTFMRPEFQDAGGYPLGPANIEQMDGPFCPNREIDRKRSMSPFC